MPPIRKPLSSDQRMTEIVSRTLFAESLTRKVKVQGGCAPAVRFTSNRSSDVAMSNAGGALTSVSDRTRMEEEAKCS